MISAGTLRAIAAGRLDDARQLLQAGRFDGAVYLCGYAVELALKARICDTLAWAGFPETPNEFRPYQSLKTHSLEVLLTFTAQEQNVKTNFVGEWSEVSKWEPESRYKALGTVTQAKAQSMIDSAATLLSEAL